MPEWTDTAQAALKLMALKKRFENWRDTKVEKAWEGVDPNMRQSFAMAQNLAQGLTGSIIAPGTTMWHFTRRNPNLSKFLPLQERNLGRVEEPLTYFAETAKGAVKGGMSKAGMRIENYPERALYKTTVDRPTEVYGSADRTPASRMMEQWEIANRINAAKDKLTPDEYRQARLLHENPYGIDWLSAAQDATRSALAKLGYNGLRVVDESGRSIALSDSGLERISIAKKTLAKRLYDSSKFKTGYKVE